MNFEEHIITERLPQVFGGRALRRYPSSFKPGRLERLTNPPVTGYVAWHDASDISTSSITFDSTGMYVQTWKDKSSSAFDAALGGSSILGGFGAPPSVFNGRTAIWTYQAAYNSSCPADDRTQTVFFVGCVPDLAAIAPMIGANNSGGRLFRIETTGKVSVLSQFSSNLFTTTTLTVVAGTPFVACAIIDTTTIEVRLNSGTPESTSNSTTFTAGRTTSIATDPNSGNRFKGWIGEVLVYGTALSSSDAGLVMDYLKAKWGTT